MRLADISEYRNDKEFEVRSFENIAPFDRSYTLFNDKDKIKLIRYIETVIRTSMEYKNLIQYLKDSIDMTKCSFYTNIDSKNAKRKISIEIHHEPFGLYDLVYIVLHRHLSISDDIRPFLIAEEVMKIHYQNMVGLIPLSSTVHELVHTGKLFIPLQFLYGDFLLFMETYSSFITEEMNDMLQIKLKLSKEVNNTSILEKKFVYMNIDGFNFPQIITEIA